ncbi:MAG: FIST C-terminal domain-containing protein [Candidatus Omnitrophica bacterium]|nr:FIST C-terminal domain-containing protein [Candidatus Omnitrophota bacterium]
MILTMHIGIGTSTSRDHIRAAQEAVESARKQLGNKKIDVVMVFSTIEFAHPQVLKFIRRAFNDTPLFGASSLGIITSERILKYGIAVCLLSLPEDSYFNTACVKEISKKSAGQAGQELGEKLLYGCKGVHRTMSIIFSDGLLLNGSELIAGLQERLGRSFPLIGASASDNFTFTKTCVYFNDEVLPDAACGILFGGKLHFGLGIQHGWKPLGKPRKVTKSNAGRVSEIDNAAAAKIYEDYFAKSITAIKKDLRHLTMLYPIGIKIPGEKEYLLHNIIDIDDSGILFQGEVPEASTIRLMIGTKESCLQAAAQSAHEARKNLGTHTPKFALIFDSASRFALFTRQANRELESIKEKLGRDTPVIGIYTYAEQAPLSAINYLGKTYFQSHTMTTLAVAG